MSNNLNECKRFITVTCKWCKRSFECPPLGENDIKNGEELPDHCQECPSEY